MALVPLRVLLDHAAEHDYGVAALNVNNMEQIQSIMEAAVDLEGMAGQVDYDYTFRRPEDLSVSGAESGAHHAFLRVRANSIEGGTSEIMRNIVGEQVLGLPGEPRVDKDVPWIKVPRS